MSRSTVVAALVVLAVPPLLAPAARAEKKAVKLIKEWKGSVADADLARDAPGYVADAGSLEKLWKKWCIEGQAPEVDFQKEIVVVSTTVGGRLTLSARLDGKGNLEVLGAATSDFRPGFRYVIATVPRAGVKAVNGKELRPAGKDRD
jgi:hypothetical protein